MRNIAGEEQPTVLRERIVVNDPAAMRSAALLGLGVARIATPDALPYLESGELVRLVLSWYADAGPISTYYASRTLLPSRQGCSSIVWLRFSSASGWPERFAGTLG